MSALMSPDPASPDPGRMAGNGMLIRMLQSALAKGAMDAETIPAMFLRILNVGAWQEFMFPESAEPHRWSYGQFKTFLESPRPSGCETKLDLIEKLLQNTPAWIPFHQAIGGEVAGRPEQSSRSGGQAGA